MYCINICCICLNRRKLLHYLCDINNSDVTYYEKLTFSFSQVVNFEKSDQYMLCEQCCNDVDFVYEFRNKCIRNSNIYTAYKTKFHKNVNQKNKKCDETLQANVFNHASQLSEKEPLPIEKNEIFLTVPTEDLDYINSATKSEENDPLLNTETYDEENNIEIKEICGVIKYIHVKEKDITGDSCTIDKFKVEEDKNDQNELEYGQLIEKAVTVDNNLEKLETEEGKIYQNEVDETQPEDSTEVKIENTEIKIETFNEEYEDCYTLYLNGAKEGKFSHLKTISETNSKRPSNSQNSAKNIEKPKRKYNRRNNKRCLTKKDKKIACKICPKEFSVQSEFISHTKAHNEKDPVLNIELERKYQCNKCKKCFKYSSNLSRHKQVHSENESYYFRRVKKNSKQNLYQCEVCDKILYNPVNLTIHKRYHTGIDLLYCTLCDARFARKYHLKRHMSVHTK